MNITDIRKLFENAKIKWSVNCLERMQERDIGIADVRSCIMDDVYIVKVTGLFRLQQLMW